MNIKSVVPESCYTPVLAFFDGSTARTDLWFMVRNPGLGGVSPLDMVEMESEHKLQKFIDIQLLSEPNGI